jgi:type IV pilus assembly protein PilN
MSKINLLPWRENLRRKRQQNFLVSLAAAVVVSAAIVLVANHLINQQIQGQEARNNYLRAEIGKLERDIQRIEELEEVRDNLIMRKNVIERLQSNRNAMVHLFNQLARTVPEGVTLDTVRQNDQLLTIAGTSESETRVSEYMRQIESAQWMRDPELEIVERDSRDDRPSHAFRFELRVRLDASEKSQ